jgi:hypothetical protein
MRVYLLHVKKNLKREQFEEEISSIFRDKFSGYNIDKKIRSLAGCNIQTIHFLD